MIYRCSTVMSLLLLSVFIFANASSPDDLHRIYRGTDADIRDYPYQASLRVYGGYFHSCGGTIISDRHILTAAHCLVDADYKPKRGITVHTGVSSIAAAGDKHEVAAQIVHPDFEVDDERITAVNDIGIIELTKPIVFNDKQKAIPLATHQPRNGTRGTIIGWGQTEQGYASEILQKLNITIVTSKNCQPLMITKLYETQVCAHHNVGYGACFGDSGGPLVANGEVIGITSYAEKDICGSHYPDVYTNVYAFLDFIGDFMNRNK